MYFFFKWIGLVWYKSLFVSIDGMIWCFKTQIVKLWLLRWLALEQCAWGYLLWPEVGCDATGRAARGRREPAWAAWADITRLLQLSCSSPLPVSLVAELWGTTVTSYLWMTPRVPILERFYNSFGIYNKFLLYSSLFLGDGHPYF